MIGPDCGHIRRTETNTAGRLATAPPELPSAHVTRHAWISVGFRLAILAIIVAGFWSGRIVLRDGPAPSTVPQSDFR